VPKPENAVTNPKILHIRHGSHSTFFTRKTELAKMHHAMVTLHKASNYEHTTGLHKTRPALWSPHKPANQQAIL